MFFAILVAAARHLIDANTAVGVPARELRRRPSWQAEVLGADEALLDTAHVDAKHPAPPQSDEAPHTPELEKEGALSGASKPTHARRPLHTVLSNMNPRRSIGRVTNRT